ncbi:hypothetical protein D6817_02750 [Candidatus Pacearchaeota archaeon]|nr:MAG: hypothetical protein D6817_02750 [Candidatus Pacearchaeota archaeon]
MPSDIGLGGPTLLSHPIVVTQILPFVLIFTIVFAVLQKSKILGEGKKQIDALVALVIGLLVISFSEPVRIIISLAPFIAVSLVVILALMILIGIFNSGENFDEAFPKRFRMVLGIVVILALVIALLVITGAWQYLVLAFFFGQSQPALVANLVFIIIIVVAVALVLRGAPSDSGGKGD